MIFRQNTSKLTEFWSSETYSLSSCGRWNVFHSLIECPRGHDADRIHTLLKRLRTMIAEGDGYFRQEDVYRKFDASHMCSRFWRDFTER